MTHSQPACGQFVWYNLVTNDPVAAAAFYGPLFGWTTRDLHIGASYSATTLRSGEHEIGGLVRADTSPAYWLPLLGVDNVEAALSEAGRRGGMVMPPAADLHGVVSLPTVIDPTGGKVCLAPASGSANLLAEAAIPGHFCWSELLANDPGRAADFYGALLGWTTVERDLGDQGRYWLFRRGDRDLAGMTELPGGTGRPSSWLPYVQVVNVEESAALAAELGGVLVTPPGDVPGRGRSAVVEDPGGALLAVFALTVAA
jgi:predicted enzyme related to lactoylglutathione lyase